MDPFEEPDEVFYADDYLIFPDATTHLDHILPEANPKAAFYPGIHGVTWHCIFRRDQ